MKPSLISAGLAAACVLMTACSSSSTPAAFHAGRAERWQAGKRTDATERPEAFALGSRGTEVASVMGHPESINARAGGTEVWYYRFSTVTLASGSVTGWNNASGNLKTRGKGGVEAEPEAPLSRTLDDSLVDRPAGAVVHDGAGGSPAGSGYTNPNTQWVAGHQRADGSSVNGYLRTTANSSRTDNFTSPGNRSPNARKRGSR